MEHYLDNAATTVVCSEAAEAALKAMTEVYGNPGSTHTKGREARKLLDSSRAQVASALGCTSSEVVFTSCGSESDNWAIIYGAEYMKHKGRHVISSVTEHDAVRKSLDELERRGFEVTRLKPDKLGAIPADDVLSAVRPDTILISLMLVNNETGAINDIGRISSMLKCSGSRALIHTDAVQAFMKIPFSASKLGADMISISGHKIHAPKGIGALYIKSGVKIKPFIVGGSQEDGRRAGTEAMPQIAAFGAACAAAKASFNEYYPRITALRESAVTQLQEQIPSLVVIGGGAPHILSISVPGMRSEVMMNYLEAKDIYVSKSSACKRGGRSHVLEAMGLDAKVIDGAIRIGLSRFTSQEDIDALCAGLQDACLRLSHS